MADKFLAELTAPGGLPKDLCWQAYASDRGALDVTVNGLVRARQADYTRRLTLEPQP